MDPNDLFNSYDKNLYKIGYVPDSGTPSADPANNLSIAGGSNELAGSGSANGELDPNPQDPDTKNSGSQTSITQQDIGNTQSGKTKFDNTEPGYILGTDKGVAKFYIGNTTNYLNWDGSSLTISGNISATTGTIGGAVISATTIVVGTGANAITLDSATGIISAVGGTWTLSGNGTMTGFSNPYAVSADETVTTYFATPLPYPETNANGVGGKSFWVFGSGANQQPVFQGPMFKIDSNVGIITRNVLFSLKSGTTLSFSDSTTIRIKFVALLTHATTTTAVVGAGLTVNTGTLTLDPTSTTDKRIYLTTYNGNIIGVMCDGATIATATLLTYSADAQHVYDIVWTGGVSAKFYIDGVLKGTITSPLPSGGNIYLAEQAVSGGSYFSQTIYAESLT